MPHVKRSKKSNISKLTRNDERLESKFDVFGVQNASESKLWASNSGSKIDKNSRSKERGSQERYESAPQTSQML